MSSLATQTNGLSKTPGSTQVIQSCDMHVTKYTTYELLGENGAGKATLFRMLAGILAPTSGAATISGYGVVIQTSEVLKQIRTFTETPVFYKHLNAAESLKLHLVYMGTKGLTPQATSTVASFPDTGERAVSKFSLGICQHPAIARALSHRPKLLILDEPINGLDPTGIREMWELSSSLIIQHQMAILPPSHILSGIEQVVDTIRPISKGRLFEGTSLADLRERYPARLEYYFMRKREER